MSFYIFNLKIILVGPFTELLVIPQFISSFIHRHRKRLSDPLTFGKDETGKPVLTIGRTFRSNFIFKITLVLFLLKTIS